MALFLVQRFLGDGNKDVDKKARAADILEKLQAEAKARKVNKDLSASPDHTEGQCKKESAVVEHMVKRSSKKTVKVGQAEKTLCDKHVSEEQNDNDQTKCVTNVIVNEAKEKLRHKKHMEHTDIVLKVSDDNATKETKKKSHKHKLPDENSVANFFNKIDNQDAEENETINSSKKRKKSVTKLTDEAKSTDHETSIQLEVTADSCVKKKKKEKKISSMMKHSDDQDVTSLIQSEENKHDDLDAEMASDQSSQDEDEAKDTGDVDKTDTDKTDIGGFTLIGSVKPAKVEKVKRVLPDWLANPSVISADLKDDHLPIVEMPSLDPSLIQKLQANNITHFFPVQQQVIPALLPSTRTGFLYGKAGYRPSDVCVSAPTGSGKTLAFVVPIVQALKARVTCEVRALILLPVRDLATQVFKVFETYCEGTCLKVGLLTGIKSFQVEQTSLVKKRLRGFQSRFDIIVATPGRLVDHINSTEGFSLSRLRFLVIDEADRMVDEIKQDWLSHVESAVFVGSRHRPGPLTARSCDDIQIPLQKLLYSATLSQNPEKLQQLNLFQPKLFTSVVKATQSGKQSMREQTDEAIDTSPEKGQQADNAVTKLPSSPVRGDFVGKYTTPSSLTERYIETTAEQKPLMVLHLLHELKFRNVLCFVNSVEATHRLYWVIKLVGGISVKEFSSRRSAAQRDKLLQKFSSGKIDIVICSDAMARGMDISNVQYVISYDPPPFIKTYVHRIGRTARAGKEGCAITLLQKKEFYHFKKMVREAGKAGATPLRVEKQHLKPLIPRFQAALKDLPGVLKREKKRESLDTRMPRPTER